MRLPVQVQAILYRKTNTKTQYLLLKRISDTGGFWQPVTGGIEKGETKTQALKREIQEETGIKNPAKITKNIHHYQFIDFFKQENRQRQIKEYAYAVEVSPNQKITISHEHTQHKWCTYKEALKLLKYKENKETLKKLNKILTTQK
jgi:dATP pyrophosphohydrolase